MPRNIFEIKATSFPLIANSGDTVGTGGVDKGQIIDTASYNGLIIIMQRYTVSATAGYAYIAIREWPVEDEDPTSTSDSRWTDTDGSVWAQEDQGVIEYDALGGVNVASSAAYIGKSRFVLPLMVGSDDMVGGSIGVRQFGLLTHSIRG